MPLKSTGYTETVLFPTISVQQICRLDMLEIDGLI